MTRHGGRHRAPDILRLPRPSAAGLRWTCALGTSAALLTTCALTAAASTASAPVGAGPLAGFVAPDPFAQPSLERSEGWGTARPAKVATVIAGTDDAKDEKPVVSRIGDELDELAQLVADADGAQEVLVFVRPADDSRGESDAGDRQEQRRRALQRATEAGAEANARQAAARRVNPTLPGAAQVTPRNPLVEQAEQAARDALDELGQAAKGVVVEQLAEEVATVTGEDSDVDVIVDPTPEEVAAAEAESERIAEEARAARASARAMSAARSDLDHAIERGTKVLDSSQGKVLDGSVRTELQEVVADAQRLTEAKVDVDDAEQTGLYKERFERHTARVERATERARDAVDEWKAEQERAAHAGRMEAYARLGSESENGKLPDKALATIGFAPGEQIRGDAAYELERLNDAFRQKFGHDLDVVSSYRSLAQQAAVKASRGFWAAKPGYSNHGWGLAVDLGGDAGSWGTAERAWLEEHAGDYGWRSPDWAQRGSDKPEPWHWEYRTDG